MRLLLMVVVVGAVLAVVPAGAAAQCATGCVSSTSCEGTGKSSCRTACQGDYCGCTDTKCSTEPLPSPLAAVEFRAFPTAAARVLIPILLIDCGGSVLELRLVDESGVQRFDDLPEIRFQRGYRVPARFAASR
jgi:hypothetical protein